MVNPMLMGAAATAAASARARRMLEAFRVADATAPGRARPLQEIGIERDRTVDYYVRAGIVCEAEPGRYYLDEAALARSRSGGEHRGRLLAVAVLLAVLGVLLATIVVVRSG